MAQRPRADERWAELRALYDRLADAYSELGAFLGTTAPYTSVGLREQVKSKEAEVAQLRALIDRIGHEWPLEN
jgi:hypothetical protein